MRHAHPGRASRVLFFLALVTLQISSIVPIAEAQFAVRMNRRNLLDPFGRQAPPDYMRIQGQDLDGESFRIPIADIRDVRREFVDDELTIAIEIDQRDEHGNRKVIRTRDGIVGYDEDENAPIPPHTPREQQEQIALRRRMARWALPVGRDSLELEGLPDLTLWGEEGRLTPEAREQLFAVAMDPGGSLRTLPDQEVPIRFEEIYDQLSERVIGQNEAVEWAARAIVRARGRAVRNRKPLSLLFLGPTGVGKTELAKAVHEVVFDTPHHNMLRFDMTEFASQGSSTRLIGGGPSYKDSEVGGQLTNEARANPYRVVLLDEFEKAHPEIRNLFLPVLDEGRITDGMGRTVDVSRALFIATTNAGRGTLHDAATGPRRVKGPLGFRSGEEEHEESAPTIARRAPAKRANRGDQHHRTALKQGGEFPPELINRFGRVLAFVNPDRESVRQIAQQKMGVLNRQLQPRGVSIRASGELIDLLVEEGYSPDFGMRPLERLIEDHVAGPIDEALAALTTPRGTRLLATVVDGEIVIRDDPEPAPAETQTSAAVTRQAPRIRPAPSGTFHVIPSVSPEEYARTVNQLAPHRDSEPFVRGTRPSISDDDDEDPGDPPQDRARSLLSRTVRRPSTAALPALSEANAESSEAGSSLGRLASRAARTPRPALSATNAARPRTRMRAR